MKLASLILATSLIGCATTGGKVSAGISGASAGAWMLNGFRMLSCDDEDGGCRDRVRNAGFVIGGLGVAALVAAIVFEIKGRPTTTVIE